MARDFAAEFPKPNWDLLINGIRCAIYVGPNPESPGFGINEANTPDGRSATVSFICYWDDRLTLIAGLLGTVDYSAGTVIRKDPFVYPLSPEDQQPGEIFGSRLFCTSISSVAGIKPWTDETGGNVGLASWVGYCYAVIQAEFTSPPYLIQDLLGNGVPPNDPSFNDLTYMTYVISKVRISGEVFSPPSGAFIFAGGMFAGNKLLDVGASQIRTRFEISTTRVRMPLVPMQIITQLLGTVNQAPFKVGAQVFPVGALLFAGVNPEPHTDPYNGGIVWDVEYVFQGNGNAAGQNVQLDWNYFLDPGGVWNPVTTVGGTPVFTYADHSQLYFDAIQ